MPNNNSTTTSPSGSPITLNVKTIESQTYSVSISLNETVLRLKERLAEMLEVACHRQRLISRGRVMTDEKSLNAPRTSTNTSTSGIGLPRFDTRDFLLSFIGVDDNADPQNIMQALAGSSMEFEGPTVIHIDGDPSAIRSIFGGNTTQAGGAGDHARARLRALANANRSVPPGASLPHLATIDAELTRAERQLRNVQTILAHPVDQLEGVELESLDMPGLDSVDDDVDGDSIDLARIGGILLQLSESNRLMANSLQALSTQYHQSLLPQSDRRNLQLDSLRAARAMYRLASVQNTVFPMLANATFVGTAPDAVTYRFQPSLRGSTHFDTPGVPPTTGARTSNSQRGAAFTIPFPLFTSRPTGGRAPLTPLGLIPSIMAHARASAQSANAALMANATNSSNNTGNTPSAPAGSIASSPSSTTAATTPTTPAPTVAAQLGSAPIGHMILGPNGSLSYIQAPQRTTSRTTSLPTYAAAAAANPFGPHQEQTPASRLMTPADFAGAGFLDFLRGLSGQTSPSVNTAEPSSSLPTSAQAAFANALLGDPTAAARATESLGRAINASLISRRRERPEDFSIGDDGRLNSRRRLSSSQPSISTTEVGNRARQEVDQLQPLISGSTSNTPSTSNLTSRPVTGHSSSSSITRSRLSPRSAVARSTSNDTRRLQASGNSNDTSSTTSSPSPSSPSTQTLSSNNSGNSSPAYNLGRIGVFISAILRMVDQPREDGSPRTLADVICNDPESPSTLLQGLVRDVAESITVREARSMVEGHPAPMSNIRPVLNTFIRERALNGQQLTESNVEMVAVMFAHGIMNAVHVNEIMETLTPPASIQISSEDIRRISVDVLREHFIRLIYLVVAVPTGRESNWPTFARDLVLWIRDVVGSWRVAFYGLFQERDQAEAQRIATHVVGSAIHANGRRWVELSNRATNTLVNVLCANIVPRRRGEEQAGGLVGGAWPLMATAPRQNVPNSHICMAPSLLGSTAPPAPLGPSLTASSALEAETLSENLTRRLTQMIAPLGLTAPDGESLVTSPVWNTIRDTIRAEISAVRTPSIALSSSETSSAASTGAPSSSSISTSVSSSRSNVSDTANTSNDKSNDKLTNSRRTRVEEVEDEDML
ncbi:hypothetical protein BGZ49_008509 [Haplosporangium sp. Z 27]|nr:hypothetical protein BGZ49_008509 [Haplosporangium sp. Z 27]